MIILLASRLDIGGRNMVEKIIGPSFGMELEAAGLLGLPFSWGEDGLFGLENCTQSEQDAVNAVLAAHDPTVIPEGYVPPPPPPVVFVKTG
jgi:hypothetical protein